MEARKIIEYIINKCWGVFTTQGIYRPIRGFELRVAIGTEKYFAVKYQGTIYLIQR